MLRRGLFPLLAMLLLAAFASQTMPSGSSDAANARLHRHHVIPFLGNRGDPGTRFQPSSQAPQALGLPVMAFRADGTAAPAWGYDRAEVLRTGLPNGETTLAIAPGGSVLFSVGRLDHAPLPVLEVARSSDDGRSWDIVWPADAADEAFQLGYVIDAYMHADQDTGRVFLAGLALNCSLLSYSDDSGESWFTDTPVCGQVDHETVFTAPPRAHTTRQYPNVVYFCAVNFGVASLSGATTCERSFDGGQTFTLTENPPYPPKLAPDEGTATRICDGGTGHGVGGRDGTIYLPRAYCDTPHLAISRDDGSTWRRVQVADMKVADEQGYPHHETSVAVDSAGNLYYVFTGQDRLPYLTTSTDGGEIWSTPVMVAPRSLNEIWSPQIAVSDHGTIAISYLGTSSSPGPPFTPGSYGQDVSWSGYITMSRNPLAKNAVFASTAINPPHDPLTRGECPPSRCQAAWDFQDVVFDRQERAWATFVDRCYDGRCDYAGLNGAAPFGETVLGRVSTRTERPTQ